MGNEKKIDKLLLIPYLVVSLVGLLMVYSASSYRLITAEASANSLFIRQGLFMLMSWILIIILYRVKISVLLGLWITRFLLLFGGVSLLLTRIGGFGVSVNGAQRWVSILGIQYQPSEIINVAIILYLAYFFRKDRSWQELKTPIVIVSVCAFLILIQPKVTGAILLLSIALVMITTIKIPYQLSLLIFSSIALIFLLVAGGIVFLGNRDLLPELFLHTYDRIIMVGNPFDDAFNKGFQMTHSYYALFNGGLWGRGLGNSITKKGYLPVSETDFIFSVLVEELGLIVGLIILGLLFLIFLRLFVLGANEKNQQKSLIYFGLGTLLFLQTSVNIASISGLIPMTGIPLPFISYGGTSYMILSFALGICMKFASEVREDGT